MMWLCQTDENGEWDHWFIDRDDWSDWSEAETEGMILFVADE